MCLLAIDQSQSERYRYISHAAAPLQRGQSFWVFRLQFESLQDSHQEEEQLGLGQGLPRAYPLARGERDEAIVLDDFPLLVQESVGIELFPLLPMVVPLKEGLVVCEDKVSPGDLIAPDLD